jgi:O-antigen/teichoic acid export membrane protein
MNLGKHAVTNLVGNVLPMLVTLVTVPLYLRFVGVERYGILAIIWALMGYFGFFDFGFGRAVSQRMARLSDAKDSERSNLLWTALTTTFMLGVVGSLLLWVFAGYVLTHLIDMSESSRNEMSSAVTWLLLALPILLPTSVLQGALQARLRFVELNTIQVLGSTLTQLLPLIVAASGYVELQILVPTALASRLLTASLLFSQCWRHVPLIGLPLIDRSHIKPLIHYGGWISVITLLGPLLVTIDRVIIASLSGAKAAAYYSVPYNLVSRTMVISGSLSSAIFPRLAAASIGHAQKIALRATTVLVAIMTPVVIIGLFVVHPFLDLWVGEAFAKSSAGVAELILLGVWINALVIPHHARLLAADDPKTVVIIYLIQIPIYFLMLWLGITYWGIMGAAAAWSLRVLVDTAMLLHVAGALKHTLRVMIPSLIIVITAALVVLETETHSSMRWAIGLILLLLSLLKEKQNLGDALNAVWPRAKLAT